MFVNKCFNIINVLHCSFFILFADKKKPSGGKIYICIHFIVDQFCFYFRSGVTSFLYSNQATTVKINMMFLFSDDFDLSDAFGPGKNLCFCIFFRTFRLCVVCIFVMFTPFFLSFFLSLRKKDIGY